ncbi:Acetolactate synthase, mitochondrial [Aspergillus melleus]|uniref:Acetolactate synthase, mitochondrial n=1 Tax=Aspergillus melleus TaxID=138277 RepID=A0ACC3B0Y9_9EURO|nr:Acetolactate synthase, mitochondrial [Aspergillus melleus]
MLRQFARKARPVCQRTAARSIQSQAFAPEESQDVIDPAIISSPDLQKEQLLKRAKHRIIPFSSTTHTSWTTGKEFKASKIELDDSFIGLTGGEIVQKMLIRHGVKDFFGYPGETILPVLNALDASKQLRRIIPQHEQGAGHMAQGYARVTGKPGIAVVTNGYGATNMITPLMDALADGTPMVVLCGQVPTYLESSEQQANILAMTQPCTKWNVSVRDVSELPRRITEAFHIATSGRPGPVLIELPLDISTGELKTSLPITTVNVGVSTRVEDTFREVRRIQIMDTIKRAGSLINMAKKPVLYVGYGVLGSPDGPKLLKELSEKASIPVTTSLQGLGAFDETDPKSLHLLGLHGSGYANMAMQHADLIICLGARFDDRVTGSIPKFAPKARRAEQQGRGGIIHFDISPKNINKIVEATVAVEGDCAENLELLLPLIQQTQRPEWHSKIDEWKARYPFQAFEHGRKNSGLIKPQKVIEELNDLIDPIKDRAIITTGVGQHQMWTAQHFRWKYPRTLVTSGGLGTMGFGLPAAIGAKVGQPDALVIDVDGDASFSMTLSELLTASRSNIDVKAIILNNEEQGMVTNIQTLHYERRFAHSHNKNPDFVRTARAMGVQAERCTDPADVKSKLKWLLETRGPAVLEVMVTKKALTLPMVPAGKGLDEFLFYENGSGS